MVTVAGILFKVVPDITVAAGADVYAGIPLAHRKYAQHIIFITGHQCDVANTLNWQFLARRHLKDLASHVSPPALLMIDEVVTLHHEINWFSRKIYRNQRECFSGKIDLGM